MKISNLYRNFFFLFHSRKTKEFPLNYCIYRSVFHIHIHSSHYSRTSYDYHSFAICDRAIERKSCYDCDDSSEILVFWAFTLNEFKASPAFRLFPFGRPHFFSLTLTLAYDSVFKSRVMKYVALMNNCHVMWRDKSLPGE